MTDTLRDALCDLLDAMDRRGDVDGAYMRARAALGAPGSAPFPLNAGVIAGGARVASAVSSRCADETARTAASGDQPSHDPVRPHGGFGSFVASLVRDRELGGVLPGPAVRAGLRAAYAAQFGAPGPSPDPLLNLSGIREEEWGMLAEMKPTTLRAALRQLAKAQAAGEA